jgi:homoserine O-acetyltransferase/O-succinyltransferase
VNSAIVIGAHDHHSTMGIALNAVQRAAIELDPIRGVGLARKIAMLTYKSEALLSKRHGRRRDRNDRSRFDIEGYLDVQALRFIERMDGKTYATLTHAMDSFDVRDCVLAHPERVTFVGISSDWLFRPQDVRSAADWLGTRYLQLESNHGHDAFLAECAKLHDLLSPVVRAPSQLGA